MSFDGQICETCKEKLNPLPIPNAVMVRVMGVAVEKFTA